MVEDIKLRAVCVQPGDARNSYGSQEDETAALKSLSAVEPGDQVLKEMVVSHFTACKELSEVIITCFCVNVLSNRIIIPF